MQTWRHVSRVDASARQNLVDPASSRMLVSKIKPCMSQNKLVYSESANGSLKQLYSIWWSRVTRITAVILELIRAKTPDSRRAVLIRYRTNAPRGLWMIYSK